MSNQTNWIIFSLVCMETLPVSDIWTSQVSALVLVFFWFHAIGRKRLCTGTL